MALGEITVQQCKSTVYLTIFSMVACFQMVLTASVIYGYSSLLVVFKDLKLYRSLCEEFTPTIGNSTGTDALTSAVLNNEDFLSCPARDKALNLPFAVGIILTCVIKIPLGSLVDFFGAKSSQYFGWYVLYID